MFVLDDVWDESKKIIGVCDDVKILRWASDVVTIICNKTDAEGQRGFLDICTVGCRCHEEGLSNHRHGCGSQCLTLPREVGTVLAVNIEGHPSLGVDSLFEFHLNGPGSHAHKTRCEYQWADQGMFYPTYRDLLTPSKVVANLQRPEDAGKALIVYGYDSAGQLLRREENGVWMDGYRVPTIFGVSLPDAEAPTIARITRVYKDMTVGSVGLGTTDVSGSGATGVLLATYEPDQQNPQFRRLRLNRCARWCRIAYMRASPVFNSRWDHVPMLSRVAFLLGMQARKHYSDQQSGDAHAYEADAARLEIEAQMKAEPPVYMPVQVIDRNSLKEKHDYNIV